MNPTTNFLLRRSFSSQSLTQRISKLRKVKIKYLESVGQVPTELPLSDKKIKQSTLSSQSLTFQLFDINFIKKERLYTKLKYSRSPAYDIVSGGSAALLSAFIGFLISEKFGIELVDSGDFYIVFMYGVFVALSCRPLLRSITFSSNA